MNSSLHAMVRWYIKSSDRSKADMKINCKKEIMSQGFFSGRQNYVPACIHFHIYIYNLQSNFYFYLICLPYGSNKYKWENIINIEL